MEPEIIGNRIKKLIKNQNLSVKDLADKMGINIEVLNRKLNGEEEFYIDELKKIKDIFNLDTEAMDNLLFKEDCKM